MGNHLSIEWHGVDGSVWDLITGREGVFMARKPSGSFYDAKMKTLWTPSAFGQKYQGKRVQRRDIIFTVVIGQDGDTTAEEWHDIESRWRLSWSYDKEGLLKVRTSDGTRTIALRKLEEPKSADSLEFEGLDPHELMISTMVMTTTAELPYWQGENRRIELEFDPDGGSSKSIDVEMWNEGDTEMWPFAVFSSPGDWTIPDWSFGQNYAGRAEEDEDRTLTIVRNTAAVDGFTITWRQDEEWIVAFNGSNLGALQNGNSVLYPVPPHTPKTTQTWTYTRPSGDTTSVGHLRIDYTPWFSTPWGSARV